MKCISMSDQNMNPESLQTVKIITLGFIPLQFLSFAGVTGLHYRSREVFSGAGV